MQTAAVKRTPVVIDRNRLDGNPLPPMNRSGKSFTNRHLG
jgi:hypothetical protein